MRIGKKMKVEPNLIIATIIRKKPETIGVFKKFGMHCVGCAISAGETLEEAAKVHNVDLKKLLTELNK